MQDKETLEYEVELKTAPRVHNGVEYINLYVTINGKRFELVPHCRSMKEKAYFYNMLARSPLALKK